MRILVTLLITFISSLCSTTIKALSFYNIQLGSTNHQIANRLHNIGFDKTESDDIEGPYIGFYLNYKAKMYLKFKNNKIERIKIRIGEYEDMGEPNDYNFTPQEAAPILLNICKDIQKQSTPLSIEEDENNLYGGYVLHYDDGIVSVAMDKAVSCKKGVIWISYYYPFLF
ncbi:MAG: hypothetical protein K2O24_09385 [Muribaculaceae bacterium]|nr:hypothetical protein [Muribaculaceae bacterium]